MSEQDLKALSRTTALLPQQEAAAIDRIAAMSPDIAKHLQQKIISELGSQALAKDMPEKSAEMKGYGNNRASVGEALTKAIKSRNDDAALDSKGRDELAATVAAASGMDKADVFKKLQQAALNKDAAQGIYAELQDKIDAKMGAAITKTAAGKKQEIYFRYEQETKRGSSQGEAYTPPAIDEQVKKELAAALDIKFMGQGLSDKEKAAVMTIAQAAPDHAKDILAKTKKLMSSPSAALDKGNQKAFMESLVDASVDSAIRSGGADTKVVDALADLAPRAGIKASKDNLSKWLQGSAAAKMDSSQRGQQLAAMALDDPERPDVERRKAEADRERERNGNSISNLLEQPGGMLMLFIGLILSAITGQDMISGLLGGRKEEDRGAGAPAPQTGEGIRIFNAKEGEASRVSGNDVHLSKEDMAKVTAYAKKNNLEEAKAFEALLAAYKTETGKKATAGDLLKVVQAIDANGEYRGLQAAAGAQPPAPSQQAAPPAAEPPAPAALAPQAGGARRPVTSVDVVDASGKKVGEMDAETLQKALRSNNRNLGNFGQDGVDGDAGRQTQNALIAYRRETGKHADDTSMRIHADEVDALKALAAQYKPPVRTAAPAGRADKVGETAPERGSAPAAPARASAAADFAISQEVDKFNPAFIKALAAQTGGMKKGETFDAAMLNDRLTKLATQYAASHGGQMKSHPEMLAEMSGKPKLALTLAEADAERSARVAVTKAKTSVAVVATLPDAEPLKMDKTLIAAGFKPEKALAALEVASNIPPSLRGKVSPDAMVKQLQASLGKAQDGVMGAAEYDLAMKGMAKAYDAQHPSSSDRSKSYDTKLAELTGGNLPPTQVQAMAKSGALSMEAKLALVASVTGQTAALQGGEGMRKAVASYQDSHSITPEVRKGGLDGATMSSLIEDYAKKNKISMDQVVARLEADAAAQVVAKRTPGMQVAQADAVHR